jgi:hypothetical protein
LSCSLAMACCIETVAADFEGSGTVRRYRVC